MVNHIFFETLKVHPWSVKRCEEGKIEQKVYETHKLQYQHLILDAFQALARGSMTPRPAPDCEAGRVSMREFLPILPRGMSTWLVVSTHLKNISQNGNLPQMGVKIKNV